MPSAAEPENPGKTSAAKRKPPLALIGACLAACGAGGAGVYFAAPASLFSRDRAAGASVGVEKPAHGEKKRKTDASHDAREDETIEGGASASGHFRIVGETGVYTPEAIVVSIRPSGRVKHLKLAIAVETDVDSEATFLAHELRIRDALNTYLRAVDVAALEDPAAMDRIRAQIARRIELVVSPAHVGAVLITDFILS